MRLSGALLENPKAFKVWERKMTRMRHYFFTSACPNGLLFFSSIVDRPSVRVPSNRLVRAVWALIASFAFPHTGQTAFFHITCFSEPPSFPQLGFRRPFLLFVLFCLLFARLPRSSVSLETASLSAFVSNASFLSRDPLRFPT